MVNFEAFRILSSTPSSIRWENAKVGATSTAHVCCILSRDSNMNVRRRQMSVVKDRLLELLASMTGIEPDSGNIRPEIALLQPYGANNG